MYCWLDGASTSQLIWPLSSTDMAPPHFAVHVCRPLCRKSMRTRHQQALRGQTGLPRTSLPLDTLAFAMLNWLDQEAIQSSPPRTRQDVIPRLITHDEARPREPSPYIHHSEHVYLPNCKGSQPLLIGLLETPRRRMRTSRRIGSLDRWVVQNVRCHDCPP